MTIFRGYMPILLQKLYHNKVEFLPLAYFAPIIEQFEIANYKTIYVCIVLSKLSLLTCTMIDHGDPCEAHAHARDLVPLLAYLARKKHQYVHKCISLKFDASKKYFFYGNLAVKKYM